MSHIHDLPDDIYRLAYSWQTARISSGNVEYFDCADKAEERLRELEDKARDVSATISNLRVWKLGGAWVEITYHAPQPPRLGLAVQGEPGA